jgi:2-polyprenyl-6-methoxyphenol hydroxylase-like FAD-dependent oxidoreductase
MRVAVVGCGTGGPAAALLLAAAGHQVEIFERVQKPAPVGAGLLLQPTGQAVLARLGLLAEVEARSARVERLHGETASGRVVMDMAYRDLAPGLHGLGVHRGVLFGALWGALGRAGIPVRFGTQVTGVEGGHVVTDGGERLGPYDLVVAADGARSCLRGPTGLVRRSRRYPWGALWTIVDDPEERHGGTLAQVYRGTREMLGFLASGRPAGTPQVSLFWSVPIDRLPAARARGLDAWKADVRRLTRRADHLLERVTEPGHLLPAAYEDVVMRQWHAGRIVFVGDAGHAMSPQLGQGVNLALLDAHILTRCLAAHADVDAALAAYSSARRAHLRFYSWASRLMTPVFQSHLGVLGPPRDLLLHPLARIPWMRRQFLASLAGAKTGVLGALDPADYRA